jgi:hypothetical protein
MNRTSAALIVFAAAAAWFLWPHNATSREQSAPRASPAVDEARHDTPRRGSGGHQGTQAGGTR